MGDGWIGDGGEVLLGEWEVYFVAWWKCQGEAAAVYVETSGEVEMEMPVASRTGTLGGLAALPDPPASFVGMRQTPTQ